MAGSLHDSTASWASNESFLSTLLAFIPIQSISESTYDTLIGLCAGREAKLRMERKRTLKHSQSLSSSPSTSFGSNASSVFSSGPSTPQHSRHSSVSTPQHSRPPSVFIPSSPIDFPVSRDGRPVVNPRAIEPIHPSTPEVEFTDIADFISPHRPPFYDWDPEQRPMTTGEYWKVDDSTVIPRWKREYERTKKYNPLALLPTRTEEDLEQLPRRKPYELLTFERRPVQQRRNYRSTLQQHQSSSARSHHLSVAIRPAPQSSQSQNTTAFPQRPYLGRKRYVNYSDSGTRLE